MFRRLKKAIGPPIKVREALRGCEAGRLQSVGHMQVVPLTSEMSDGRFVSPVQCEADVYTTSYGTLGFRNLSESVMIVPCHAGYVVNQYAQDHAMAHVGVVQAADDRRFDTAACIQAAQGGFIKQGSYRMLILPHALREQALSKRREKNYQKLWPSISEFNQRFGLAGQGHLEFFLKAFKKELDEFVAEFESVPRQIGAIILIDDRVVGIERAPSHGYWESIWPSLIRECYGSLAIEAAKANADRGSVGAARSQLPIEIASLDELGSLIAELASREDERAKSVVRELLDESLDLRFDEQVAELSIVTAVSNHFQGQLIRDGEQVVYASLPATNAYVKSQEWSRAEPFLI